MSSMYLGYCLGFQEMSVLDEVAGIDEDLLASNGVPVTGCFIDAEGSPFRYRLDGGDPTASRGHREDPSSQSDEVSRITIVGASNIGNFRAISEDGIVGTDFTITIAYGG